MHKTSNAKQTSTTPDLSVSRLVTIEASNQNKNVVRTPIPPEDPIVDRLKTALREIKDQVKSSNDVKLSAGSFYFKVEAGSGNLVLQFASQVVTDPPIVATPHGDSAQGQAPVLAPIEHFVER